MTSMKKYLYCLLLFLAVSALCLAVGYGVTRSSVRRRRQFRRSHKLRRRFRRLLRRRRAGRRRPRLPIRIWKTATIWWWRTVFCWCFPGTGTRCACTPMCLCPISRNRSRRNCGPASGFPPCWISSTTWSPTPAEAGQEKGRGRPGRKTFFRGGRFISCLSS